MIEHEPSQLVGYRQRLVSLWAGMPGELAQQLHRIDQAGWYQPVQPGGWNPHQVLTHLCDMEHYAFLPRIEILLEQDFPFLESFSGAAWMEAHYRREVPWQTILSDYASLRLRELELLHKMPPDGWSRTGRHPGWGVRTLQWWVEHSLAHAHEHLEEQGWSN